MKISRTPARLLWEGKLIRYMKELSGKKVLEVGCAMNTYSTYCNATNTIVRTDVKPSPRVDRVEDVTSLSFENNSFDVIILSNVLEHVYYFQKAVDECFRVLKRGGEIVVIVPFLFPLHDEPGDYWRFSQHALQKLFEKFSFVKIENIGAKRLPFYYYAVAKK